jgi:hypothetical protein
MYRATDTVIADFRAAVGLIAAPGAPCRYECLPETGLSEQCDSRNEQATPSGALPSLAGKWPTIVDS